ncbi:MULTISPECIES: biotin transporter BioY [Wolbachia]|uniref:biotin transporter BioY n=1 Tax=Wolbachia TaxID=953 RepID=UPI0002403F4E|nr:MULTISPECIES: biotin transporter BioY [Wolbachia]UYC24271.1 biotin transporter BioY [Wolbachia endosymbiont of Aedes aegypti]QBB84425.1 biotin transporter BioY [Wolbachia pipientis wAlbB]QDW09218.1 biotin transporter BioY [Wolbachia pipientis]QDW10416.1 biotin transporter BioY [Wolbachia pipientis]QZA83489.1 biotin transporter BioY [Wolbachia pipientis]
MFITQSSSRSTLAEILSCVLLLFLMAQISIPLQPVPITLQTLGLMLVGLKFNRRTAFYSVLTYLSLGAAGFPVFANFSGGHHIFLGPTGGYLIGCLVAVVVMSRVNELLNSKYKSFMCNSLSCLAGTVVIFICGISWLAIYVGLKQAIMVGVLPFILPGLVKIFLLVAALQYLKK